MCNSCVMCHMVRMDSSALRQKLNCIYFSFIKLAEPLDRWRRGGNCSTRRKPLATSFRKCHILQCEDSNPKRDLNPYNSIGGRKADMLTITPRVRRAAYYSWGKPPRGRIGKKPRFSKSNKELLLWVSSDSLDLYILKQGTSQMNSDQFILREMVLVFTSTLLSENSVCFLWFDDLTLKFALWLQYNAHELVLLKKSKPL